MIEGITKLYHPNAGIGTFKEFIKRTPHGPKYVIVLDNGREYFAPCNEFIKIEQ